MDGFWRLRSDDDDICFVRAGHRPPENAREEIEPSLAIWRLGDWLGDSGRAVAADIYSDIYDRVIGSDRRMGAADLELALRDAIVEGRIRVFRLERTLGGSFEFPADEGADSYAAPARALVDIAFKVIHDLTADPIADVKLKITLPDGSEGEHITNADGMVEFTGIKPGSATVASDDASDKPLVDILELIEVSRHEHPKLTEAEAEALRKEEEERAKWWDDEDEQKPSPPPQIRRVRRVHVRTGATLEGIAARFGKTKDELTNFNWQTADPDKVNEHLRDYVGSFRKKEDDKTYEFDALDDPGIVYLPESFSVSGRQTEATHIIRVLPVRPDRAIIGCVWVRFVTRHDYPIRRVPCQLFVGKRPFKVQDTSDEGEVFWDEVPFDDCCVKLFLPDHAARAEVPWFREKAEVHHLRFMEAHHVLGKEDNPRGIQVRLIGLDYDCGAVDGILGSSTEQALKDFQKDTELVVDGVPGPVTCSVLHDVYDRPNCTGQTVEPPTGIYLRLNIDPNDEQSGDDRFRLFSSDGSYDEVQTIKDDKVLGDSHVDLLFEADPGKSYSLEIDPGQDGDKYMLFSGVPYERLAGLEPDDDPAAEEATS